MLRRSGWGGYLEFLLLATAAAGLLAVGVGGLVRRLEPTVALDALVAGCVVGWLAAVIGGLVVARDGAGGVPPQRILAATGLRFLAAALLAGLVLVAGDFDLETLLLWTGISYVALLPLDTIYALRRAAGPKETEESDTETP